MKKKIIAVLVVLALLLVTIYISFIPYSAINTEGFGENEKVLVSKGYIDDIEYLLYEIISDEPILLLLSRSDIGKWEVVNKGTQISFIENAGTININNEVKQNYRREIYAVGRNAVEDLYISQDELPKGISVDVMQYNEYYRIHAVTFISPEEMSSIDIVEIIGNEKFAK